MIATLPPPTAVRVTTTGPALTEQALAELDAVVLLLDRAPDVAQTLATLPFGALWQALLAHERRAGNEWPILATRLPNGRQTLAVAGFVRTKSTGFERLDLAGKLAHEVVKPGVARLQVHSVDGPAPRGDAHATLEAVLSAVLAHAAPMPELKSAPTPAASLAHVEVGSPDHASIERCVAEAKGNHLARWLATLPPNVLDSPSYRAALEQLATREGWGFDFLDVAALEKLGAGAFLAVARANAHGGAGIARLSYRPPRPQANGAGIALVGKGICFDTGGINLKPHKSMFTMHGDMQGSAVAVGTLLALSQLQVPYAVDCWLAITENQIGPTAFRPQEVVRAANGVTIQVVHSDAEGRMVLADALTLASREKPRLVVDFATLTGACVVALGDRYAGAFTNRAGLHDWLQRTGRDSGERVWCFPMDEDFDVELESKVADVQQCTPDSKGDHILAARFLSRFVEPDVPWVHLDLAASEHKGGLAHVPTEFTGFGVRYAVHLLGDAAALDERLKALGNTD
ncbi:MAG TPA: M17 family metallopeptidase [Steroidobacteraceae bacterium]|nr:M17 family metallopeptidase [Steroidobacteraceae bacterium]